MNDTTGSLEIRWMQGFSNKNIKFVDNKTVCYTCGSHICFLNLETKSQSVFQSPGRGVSVLTANGQTGIFAFSEQKLKPSIFVYHYPQLHLKSELKGGAEVDYTSLALSDGGPYLGCCTSFPDHKITVWNWENAEQFCSQTQHGQGIISLTFNPFKWCQLCALGKSSITLWNIEKNASFHVLKPSVIELPATDGSFVERLHPTSPSVNKDFTYFGPEFPGSAIIGPRASKAEISVTEAQLTPSAICWLTASDLYVGCEEGFLLLVDSESLSVSVLFNPRNADAIPELKHCSFHSFALNRNGLITVGKKNMVFYLQVKQDETKIRKTWQLDGPVTTVLHSPDKETLLLSSDMGKIYMLDPTCSDVVNILEVLCGNFVAAAMLQSDQNICVSVRESGELQLWSRDGNCLSSLSLHVQVTSMACCPIAQYAALGTKSGHVLFIDLNKKQHPRLVHKAHLYYMPVDHLVFDHLGHFLFTGALDPHIYLLNTKPAKRFTVTGYKVVPGTVLSLSTQNIRESELVKVLALCSGKYGKTQEGNLLTLFTIPARDLAGLDCVNQHGYLSDNILKVSAFEVPTPVVSCVLGEDGIFAYCHRKKVLQRFKLPQDIDSQPSDQMVQLQPIQEVKGHPLGPVSLALSPNKLWLASVGRDGLLRILNTAYLEQYTEQRCHSYRYNGVRSVSFSADSQMLLTTGFNDGSLVCTNFRPKDFDVGKGNKATLHSQTVAYFLKNIFDIENPLLIGLPEWCENSVVCDVKTEAIKNSEGVARVTLKEPEYRSNSLATTLSSDSIWLESRKAVVNEDDLQHFETKKNLRQKITEIRNNIQGMINFNENIPEIERLELREFNLDTEEQKRLDVMVQEEVTKVRNEIDLEILEKCFLYDVIKRECWDSLKVKGRAIKAFHSEYEVRNYPCKERTEKELEDLKRVENMRLLEMDACNQSSRKSSNINATEQEQCEEDDEAEGAVVTDSYTADLGCSQPYLYNQLSLYTSEQKMNQIILLQDVIYRIKTAFNNEFDATFKQKVLEINHVRDMNRQIMEILVELEINMDLWEPELTDSEWPERLFTVDDSEIKAEKFPYPAQTKEERNKLEEQRCLAPKSDSTRKRALNEMMNGVLEVKKEDFLKKELPVPEFALTKPNMEWSAEEKKAHNQYEKKAEELSIEKEKYKKLRESEVKKLQATIKDSTDMFDENLKRLFEKKIKCDISIYQEQFKITWLLHSVHMEELMMNRELELKFKLKKMIAYKDEMEEAVMKQEREVELFLESYENIVAEDKVLDKEFRKDFCDIPRLIVDHLYKLFKNRPRIHKRKTQQFSKSNSCPDENHFSQTPGGIRELLTAMEELDKPENMPDGLNPLVWERFCLVRRTKAANEQKVKLKALNLDEMQVFLQKRREEYQAAQDQIKYLTNELESLQKKKKHFLMDTMIQTLLKQGQVEVNPDPIPDYSDSILLDRTVVEDLNSMIIMHGDQMIATMEETKDLRKAIIKQEWEIKMKRMQIEDLKNQARDIQMLRLTEDQKEYLNKTDRDSRVTKQVCTLKENIAFHEKIHLKEVMQRKQKIRYLNMQAASKTEKITDLDQQIQDVERSVAEMRQFYQDTAVEEDGDDKTEEHYQEILERKKLKDTVRAQFEELSLLGAELERLRMKNFPSLDQMQHS